MAKPRPQVLGFKSESNFKAYFFKHFVRAMVFANRCGTSVRVIFRDTDWIHVFWDDGRAFDLARAERLPWILEALQRPEQIREGRRPDREVYLLTRAKWGEDFSVIVRAPNKKGVSYFVTAYPLEMKSLLKILTHRRACQ